MANAKKDSGLTTQDMHATGTEVAGEPATLSASASGTVKPLDMHATGGTATTDDMHATSEPVT
ncbi:hypothetical protein OG233_18340 [Streptomyces sp. NBC_01218]|uniref:hypothetical protein n=1 Tax=unclassified Streptomyces TaxID=2593676 RepID=UPI0023B926F0|nr:MULTISPECIES: hypothetical protein [unclassified Streptomyces]WEH41327.1 hypothetical protein PZB77_18505 [Streptomyces sp. AM 2-1-1]WSQ52956.1 hypothetical protein OG233_18340 [Streptomyces sp. NBC_01218]